MEFTAIHLNSETSNEILGQFTSLLRLQMEFEAIHLTSETLGQVISLLRLQMEFEII